MSGDPRPGRKLLALSLVTVMVMGITVPWVSGVASGVGNQAGDHFHVTDKSVAHDTVVGGDNVTVDFNVTNVGDSNGSQWVKIYVSNGTWNSSGLSGGVNGTDGGVDVTVLNVTTNTLSPNETQEFSKEITIPSEFARTSGQEDLVIVIETQNQHIVPINVTAVPEGDANGDGSVSSGDATLALRDVVGLSVPSSYAALAADASDDGSVSSGDATLILRDVVGLTNLV